MRALDQLLRDVPEPVNTDEIWSEAIAAAALAEPMRGRDKETPAARMRRLRDQLKGELVAFHDALIVAPYQGDIRPTTEGAKLWDVQIPLTLFPKRDRGFSRIECLVEFATDGDAGVRVRALLPAARAEVLARAAMGGKLDLKTQGKVGLTVPLPQGETVVEVAGSLYGSVEGGPFVYQARRDCLLTEIVRGTAGRWRLDDARNHDKIGAESHQLGVVLEVAEDAGPVHAAGYLQAYSEMGWLTAELGSVWAALAERIKAFFSRGAPAEAYAQWEGVIPGAKPA